VIVHLLTEVWINQDLFGDEFSNPDRKASGPSAATFQAQVINSTAELLGILQDGRSAPVSEVIDDHR
jgi:hypothetical protein